MARRSTWTLVAAALCAASAARSAVGTKAATTVNWITEHHDVRNSGLGDFVGPGEATGACASEIIDVNPFDTTQPYYYSTGVLTESNEYMVVGNSANILQIIEVETQAITSVNLTSVVNGSLVSTWGITASGSITYVKVVDGIIYDTDRLFQGSADGHLYAINSDACVIPSATQNVGRFLERDPANPRLLKTNMQKYAEAAAAEAEAAGVDITLEPLRNIPCVQWVMAFDHPVYAPTRYIPADKQGRFLAGIVLVSDTNEHMDSDGTLHAIDAGTGAYLWNISTLYINADGTNTTAGLRYVPAIDMRGGNGDAIGYLGFGRDVIAFDVYTGAIIGTTNNTQVVTPFRTPDIFVSSPTLTTNGTGLFIHSATGSLWAMNVTVAAGPSVTLNFSWACDYFGQGTAPVCDTLSATVSAPRFDMQTHTLGSKTLPRASLVNGGFPQPTTLAEREELYDTIRSEWLARYTLASMSDEEKLHVSRVASSTHPVRLLDTLPASVIHSLVTPSGYCMLNAAGKPALFDVARLYAPSQLAQSAQPLLASLQQPAAGTKPPPFTYGGVFPYATPSLTLGDTTLMIAQYQVNSGPSALFSVNPATGAQNWAFQNLTAPDKSVLTFGRSRSSPAVDQSGNVYIGTDSDDIIYTMPLLFALRPDGTFNWVVNVGTDNVRIGSASAVVSQGYYNEKRLYMVSGYNVISVDEGVACPGQVNPFTFCSGNGVCNCSTGKCTCSNICRTGADCSVPRTCGGHGTCDVDKGCVCDACWSGPNCDVPLDCGPNGQCNPNTGTCDCTGCFTGAQCNQPQTCNGHGTCSNGVCSCDKCSSGTTCENVNTCNGNGDCNGATGVCTCDLCFSGDSCDVMDTCDGHGVCIRNFGCRCQAGYGPGLNGPCLPCLPCTSGFNCEDTNLCNGHGTCNNNSGQCQCQGNYDPASGCSTCDSCHGGLSTGCNIVINTCSGHGVCVPNQGCVCSGGYSGAGCDESPSSNTGGAVAAGILIPATVIGAAVGLFFWKKRNPHKPWAALLPNAIAKRIGMNGGGYAKLQFATSSNTPKEIRQPIAPNSTSYGTSKYGST